MDRINGLWAGFLAIPGFIMYDELFIRQSWALSLPLFGESILFRVALFIVGIGAIIGGLHHNPEHDDSVFLHNLILLGLGTVMIYISVFPSVRLQMIMMDWFWGIPYWSLVFMAFYVFIGSILLPIHSYSKKIRINSNQKKNQTPDKTVDPNQTFILKVDLDDNFNEDSEMPEIFT
jgi:hypothetical protein